LEKFKLIDLGDDSKKTLQRLGMEEVLNKEMKKLQRKGEGKMRLDKI